MKDCHFKPKEKGLSKKLKENIQERQQINDAKYSIKPVRKMIIWRTSKSDNPYHIFPAAKSLQSCATLCDLIDGSPPSSLVPEILQARPLEWVATSFSNA